MCIIMLLENIGGCGRCDSPQKPQRQIFSKSGEVLGDKLGEIVGEICLSCGVSTTCIVTQAFVCNLF